MKLIKLPQVRAITLLSTATIYRLISEGKFPKQIKLSERTSCWLESEVMDYINKRIEARDK